MNIYRSNRISLELWIVHVSSLYFLILFCFSLVSIVYAMWVFGFFALIRLPFTLRFSTFQFGMQHLQRITHFFLIFFSFSLACLFISWKFFEQFVLSRLYIVSSAYYAVYETSAPNSKHTQKYIHSILSFSSTTRCFSFFSASFYIPHTLISSRLISHWLVITTRVGNGYLQPMAYHPVCI